MSTIDRIVPVLARTVMAIAIISTFAAGFAAYAFAAPRLLAFAGFAMLSGIYAWRVTKQPPRIIALPEAGNSIRPMAA